MPDNLEGSALQPRRGGLAAVSPRAIAAFTGGGLALIVALVIWASLPGRTKGDAEAAADPDLRPDRPLAPFVEPVIPIPPGKQTKLRALATVKLWDVPKRDPNAQPWHPKPTGEPFGMAYSSKHRLLFVCADTGAYVYDTATGNELGRRPPSAEFMDLSLAPDESALFVSDFGGEDVHGRPVNPSRFHRYDLAARAWEDRLAPKIAGRIEAVDSHRVLSLERDQWVDLTLNLWERNGTGARELARASTDSVGDIEYDPRTGRVYHGNSFLTAKRVTLVHLVGNALDGRNESATYSSASEPAVEPNVGGSVVLSRDRSRLYYGGLQVSAARVSEKLAVFPEVIRAAARDVAFGARGYYRASSAAKLGAFEFATSLGHLNPDYVAPAVIAVAPDGLSVWVVDRDKNVARQFALEEGD